MQARLYIPSRGGGVKPAEESLISAISERLNLKEEQAIANVQKYGNTSAASIAIAMAEAVDEGKIQTPATIAISGFGAGLTWGTAIIKLRVTDKRKE